jgi:hypothetical protein
MEDNPTGARIYINGQEIHGVTSVEYRHHVGELAELTMDIGGMELEGILMDVKVDEKVHLIIE